MGCPSRISPRLRAWREEWLSGRDLADRQLAAARSSALAVAALEDYSHAYRRDLNSHSDGVSAVAILKLLDHLRFSTGLDAGRAEVDDVFDLIAAVRIGAHAALARGDDAAAAHATLAELSLVSGDQASPADRDRALAHYTAAGASGEVRESLLERLQLFGALGFRPALVSGAILVLEAAQ